MIDPFEIPCVYCGRLPVVSDKYTAQLLYYCPDCEQAIPPEEWITGGINAMAGKLMRKGIYIFQPHPPLDTWWWGKEWHHSPKDLFTAEISFNTFEEAVLDAWKHLMRSAHETGDIIDR